MLSLSDKNIGEAVNLRMLRKGYNFLPTSKKCNKTLGFTILIESNMLNKSFSAKYVD